MVRLCVTFFTHDMIRAIRDRYTRSNKNKTILMDVSAWRVYREYHNQHLEPVNSRNAVFILNEFLNVCETIATFPPNEHIVLSYLWRRYN